MKLKACVGKNHHGGVGGFRAIVEDLRQVSSFAKLHPGPPEYEAPVLTTHLQREAMNVNTCLTDEIQFIVVSYYISRR